MYNNSFRIRIATGTLTLPCMAGIATLLFPLPAFSDLLLWLGLGFIALNTYLLAELNNRHTLIRVRSRMVCSTFLALYASCPPLHSWTFALIPMLCLILSYFQFFYSYQEARPQFHVFQGFLYLGIASWFYPMLLLMVPVLYVCLLIPLRALTWRSFFSGGLGILLPFWFYSGWAIWNEQLDTAFATIGRAFLFPLPDYTVVPMAVKTTFLFTALSAIAAIVHLLYTAYNDKIRTRMYYYVIICVELLLLAACLLQPQHYRVLLSLLIANSAPLIAHHYTLAKGRIMDYWFVIALVFLSLITLFNYTDLWKNL
ncbi:hypothetical protein, membrane [gut metagenome]|uniref:Transmembrane protein n=1 Tax=gut metagenome TaxID=749906 RepID=J9FIG0_9ZZZZ